uniref:Hymenoptaecin 1 n=1 Tax=Odontomachus monticola TaxID=613454 RepID=A0A348G6C2_ODOMO
MKLLVSLLALSCAIVYASADLTGDQVLPQSPGPVLPHTSRFPREADPQNSISFQGSQPLSGPNRQPTWDLNVNRNIANNDRSRTDIFGGIGKAPGQSAQPHIGIQHERNLGRNGFIRGSGQLQPGYGGRGLTPSFGVTGGLRFRREAEDAKDEDDTELIEE